MIRERTKKYNGKYLRPRPKDRGHMIWTTGLTVLLATGCLCFFAAVWYRNTYGDTGFDSILYTLSADLEGVQGGLILSFSLWALLPMALCAAAGFFLLWLPREKWLRRLLRTAVPVLSVALLTAGAVTSGLHEYLYGIFNETPLFEHYYVAPDEEIIDFPEEKRNLIYIFLESMEVSYLSEELGGAEDVNLIPELYTLAQQNLNFSHNAGVGGFLPVNGATWTIGAMVAHTAGVPLKTPSDVEDWQNGYGKEGEFLPGITALQDILDEAGYHQALMVGSVASFGGRSVYYETHGTDVIYDLSTARRDGIVPGDYFVWWGMEDEYLFEYAKQELTEMADREEPFAFTMLTVDTHHIGGYLCANCESVHEEQYENVIACSSRQVAEFVDWIQDQEFYEDTTIIITGDHPSMDNGYFDRNIDEDYVRRMYNCFINVPVETKYSHNRQFSALDMFPTTLAALGCTIEGEYLGLGVNLFSGKPTLIERLGYERFDLELSLSSDYDAEIFRLEEPEETED